MLALDRSQAPQQLAGPEQLDLDGCIYIGLKVLHNLSRDCRGVQEFVARVPFDFGLLPPGLEVLVLNDPPSLAAIEKAEGGAEGGGRPGEPEDIATGERILFPLFFHAAMLGTSRRNCQGFFTPLAGFLRSCQIF